MKALLFQGEKQITCEGVPDPDGAPQWIPYDDGLDDGSLDLQAWAVRNAYQNDDVIAWTVTYFTYDGPETTISFCFSSDDGGAIFLTTGRPMSSPRVEAGAAGDARTRPCRSFWRPVCTGSRRCPRREPAAGVTACR